MAVARSFRISRLTLPAGILVAVTPPATFVAVSLGNGTGTDLEVHTTRDGSEYLVIASGYERTIGVGDKAAVGQVLFNPSEVACWLKSSGGGTVILIWH